MDYIYHWNFIYRDKHEVLNFARAIPESTIRNIEVIEELPGINDFLKINKN